MTPEERVQLHRLQLSVGICIYIDGGIRLFSAEILIWVFLGQACALGIFFCGVWIYWLAL